MAGARRNFKDPKTGVDVRYDLIRPMYEKGKIERLRDIQLFVPKTVIARDIGYRTDRWNELMQHPEEMPLRKLLEIGKRCGLTEREMMELFLAEYEALKKEKVKSDKISRTFDLLL